MLPKKTNIMLDFKRKLLKKKR